MVELLATLLTVGQPLAQDITVELVTEPNDPGGTRWHGRLKVPARTPLSLGQACDLAFQDGRRGSMEITRLTYGRGTEDIRVFFRGRSPLA
jgi:hypothetical protein